MDQAHEVERAALLRGDLQVDLLALLARAGDAGVARTVDVRWRVLARAVLQVLELRRSVAVRVGAVRLAERLADLALVDGLGCARQILQLHDRERVRAL